MLTTPVEESVLAEREGPLGLASGLPTVPRDILETADNPLLVTAGPLENPDADELSFTVDKIVLGAVDVLAGSDNKVPTFSGLADTEEEAVLIAVEKLPGPDIGVLVALGEVPRSVEEIPLVAADKLLD